MKILITGANGYIGRSLLSFYKNRVDLVYLSRDILDLSNKHNTTKWFEDKEFDIVLHTAISGGNRIKVDTEVEYTNNVKMIDNLYQHKDKFSKLISFGSGAEYTDKESYYGKSKIYISDVINSIPGWCNLRIYGLFDHNEKNQRFIKSNILRYIHSQPIEIYENKYMDFIYMEDFLSIVDEVMRREDIKTMDCVYDKKYTLLDIAGLINQLGTHKVSIINQQKRGIDYIGIPSLKMDYIGLEQGIRRAYERIEMNLTQHNLVL